MKLTRRQADLFRDFLDLYRELQGPIHYSVLAKRVGVSRITAYDMLRVLEEKGYVASEYRRAAGKSGPGRAEIIYWPTEQAQRRVAEISGLAAGNSELLAEKVMEYLQDVELLDPAGYELAVEMLARIPPDGPSAVQYCVEVMTVLVLGLRRGAGRALLLAHLPHILPDSRPPSATEFNLLCGIAVGILLNEDEHDQEWAHELLMHSRQYFALVNGMTLNNRRLLATHLRQILLPLKQMQASDQTGDMNETNNDG